MIENFQIFSQITCLEKLTNKVLNYVIDVKIGTFVILPPEQFIEKKFSDDKLNKLISKLSDKNPESYFHKVSFVDENSIYMTISKNTEVYDYIEWTGKNDPINQPSNGAIYDKNRNGFIKSCPVEGYILNESTLEWQPDPTITYDLHGDGKYYRYDVENNCWWPTW